MDTDSLRLFLHLSHSLHYGRTSRECHKSPSALSRVIQRLEQEVGTPLFERDSKRVALTPQGELMQRYASEALARWDELKSTLKKEREALRGTLSVFASVTACQSFLPRLLGAFRQAYPDIQLRLETGYAVDALDMLARGAVDVTVAALPRKVPRDLVARVVAVTPLILVAPTAPCEVRRLVEKRPIDWAEVPMILPAQGLSRDDVDRWFRARRAKPRIYSELMGNEAILALVSTGSGVGVVPKLVLEQSPLRADLRALEVEPPIGEFRVGVCAHRRSLANPIVEAFWKAIA
jgi:LysR family positive regulator for ilvC